MGILSKLAEKISSAGGGNTLYYPGCLTKYVSVDIEKNYQAIFRKSRIDFIQLKEIEQCCGSPVYNAGYAEDFRNLIKKNLQVFKEHNVTKIITNCPACYKVFSKDYPENSREWNIKAEHATIVIWNAVKNGKLKVKKCFSEEITYHDPCHLGRHCGIYEEPREILKAIGFSIKEMANNREDALCCGGGGGLKTNQPAISNRIADMRIKQAEETGVKKMLTTCPLCYHQLKENCKNLEVYELSEVLIKCLQ
jgi:Fe-S oxidoreductase